MKTRFYIALLILTACASAPVKDFKTIRYLPQDANCFERLLDDDTVEIKCYLEDTGNEDDVDWVTIRKSFFNKELDYQDLLIKSCKKWK